MAVRRWAVTFALLLAASSASSAAFAGASGKDRAEAAVLTSKGRAAFRAKRYDEAADALRKAEQLDPSPQRKLELAKALVLMNKLVEASQVLNAVVNDPSLGAKDKWLKDSASKQLGTFESRIPWLSVHVTGPSKAHVEVDGKEVEAEVEAPVDPGKHTVGVDAEGYASADKDVTLNEGEHKSVTLVMEASAKGPVADKPVEKSSGGTKWPAFVSFGLGAGGLVLGTVFGVLAFDETAKAKQYCTADNKCPARVEVVKARNYAIANGNVSTAMFVVGGVGVAAGVVLLLTVGSSNGKDKDKDKDKKEESGFVVRPYVGPSEIGVVGRF